MQNPDLRAFFEKYAEALNNKDINAIAGSYARQFIAAGPKGSAAYPNDETFIEWLKQVEAFNEKTGMEQMEIVHVEISPVSGEYESAKVSWRTSFRSRPGEAFSFDITYIVEKQQENYAIILFISHLDQEEYMKEKGLL